MKEPGGEGKGLGAPRGEAGGGGTRGSLEAIVGTGEGAEADRVRHPGTGAGEVTTTAAIAAAAIATAVITAMEAAAGGTYAITFVAAAERRNR